MTLSSTHSWPAVNPTPPSFSLFCVKSNVFQTHLEQTVLGRLSAVLHFILGNVSTPAGRLEDRRIVSCLCTCKQPSHLFLTSDKPIPSFFLNCPRPDLVIFSACWSYLKKPGAGRRHLFGMRTKAKMKSTSLSVSPFKSTESQGNENMMNLLTRW